MQISFVGQPFEDFGQLADRISELMAQERLDQLQIAVAWAKRSGLSRLQQAVSQFRDQGGTANAVIGIDEGGATKQGLELAMSIFDEVHIFHDHAPRTFHPKVYLLHNKSNAELIVGSNNITAGGLWNNYEASLVCSLDLSIDEDRELFDQVSRWFTILYSDEVCPRLQRFRVALNQLASLKDAGIFPRSTAKDR